MKWLSFSGCLLLIFIVSCTTPKPVTLKPLPVNIPGNWSHGNKDKTENVQPWLDDFNDPELKKIVLKALKKNFDLKAAASRMYAANAIIRQTKANRLPQASARAGYSVFNNDSKPDGKPELDMNISWELDLWAKFSDLKKAELAEFKANLADYQMVRLSISVNVAKIWFSAIEKKEQIFLAKQRVESFKNNLGIINDSYDQGIASELDIRLTLSDVARAENRLEEEKESFDTIIRGLKVLLGDYPSNKINIPDKLKKIENSVPAGLPSQMLKRRPDLIAAENRYIESGHRLDVANKNRLPGFSLTGQAGTSSPELKNLLNIDFLILSIVGQLSQPLFTGGRLKAEREIALEKTNEQLAKYSQVILDALLEVETALARETFLSRQETFLETALKESQRAENFAIERYLEGLSEIIVLLESQRRTYEAKRSLIQVINKKIQNRLNLYLALGGEFQHEEQNL